MKKVLIVGCDSYIGSSFERYVQGRLEVTTVDARNDEWLKIDYSAFDSVIYVAGIAHRKQTKDNKDLYFKVNRDLAVAVAQKARAEGVKHFIYFSSMAVYGMKKGVIAERVIPAPIESDYYGFSKYQAEKLIQPMHTDSFYIAIIRPPMVYGLHCKGKFQGLLKIARAFPVIPTLENKRSVIYIENLTELMAIIVEQDVSGTLCPQNKEYVSTSNMLAAIQNTLGNKVRRLPLLNVPIYMFLPLLSALQSAFGNLYYDASVSKMPFDQKYQLVGFEESIKRSVEGYMNENQHNNSKL